MIDLLFLSKNRFEFTELSLGFLVRNTNWSLVKTLWLYDDCSSDGADGVLLRDLEIPSSVRIMRVRQKAFGGPVAVMNDFIGRAKPELFAKIDNDIAVPPGWLDVCLEVMQVNPELDLLGIEPMDPFTCLPAAGDGRTRWVERSSHIGGIGLMRGRAFERNGQPYLPVPSETFFGFTHFQHQNPDITRGWLTPPLPVVLLDRIPLQPFRGCAEFYIKQGWARRWPTYDTGRTDIWSWLIDAMRGVTT